MPCLSTEATNWKLYIHSRYLALALWTLSALPLWNILLCSRKSAASSLPGSYPGGGFQDSQCTSSIMIWRLHFSQSRTDEGARF